MKWIVVVCLALGSLTWNVDALLGQSRPCRLSLPLQNQSNRSDRPSLRFPVTKLGMAKTMEPEEIKQQLEEYLQTRREQNADELAKQEKGKVIGGTKGNKVLEYISGAPVKEQVVERIPNVFDYDQLTKYGYSNLVTPIMEMGGRRAVYELMGMEAPPPTPMKKVVQVPKLVIDRTGEDDEARYSGLKMGQLLNDDAMAEALARANEKAKRGESLRPKLKEEDFELPYADKRNIGPRLTPDWTPERIDEYTKKQGKAIDWARRARLGEFVKDPLEVMDLNAIMRLYLAFSVMEISLAFGQSTPKFLDMMGIADVPSLLSLLQVPALILTVANIGSCAFCGAVLAPPLNRDSSVWYMKGFFGGPLAVLELRSANALITRGEAEQQKRDAAAANRREPNL